MYMDNILDAVRANITETGKFGLYNLAPDCHRFFTYDTPKKQFEGSDLYAFIRRVTLTVSVFYRSEKTADDAAAEKNFERAVRMYSSEFQAACGYDTETDCYYTQYTFNLTEEI